MILQFLRTIGLLLPPLVWAVSLQMGEILPYADCRTGHSVTAWIALASAAFAACGCLILWLVSHRVPEKSPRFVNRVGLHAGAIFIFAVMLQGAAALLIDPCAH